MWWFRRPLIALAVLTVTWALAGCGFRPLYAESAEGGNVLADFAEIKIAPIPDRVGQQIRNDLLDLLTPRGTPRSPRYVLNVTVDERIRELAVQRTGLATRANLRLDAAFTLTDPETNQILFTGETFAFGSYNLVDAYFSTLTAQNDARERAARELALDIRTRLAAYFAEGRQATSTSQ